MEGLILAGGGIIILALGFIHHELQCLIRVMVHQDPRSRVEVPSRFFPMFFVIVGLIVMAYGLFNGLMAVMRTPAG